MKNIVLSCLESRVETNQNFYGRFLLAPFQNGNALTMGTALRRALLSHIEGTTITALDIQGTTHEFSTIVGLRESVLELSLNFQRVILRNNSKSKKVHVGYLQVQGPAVIYANDLNLPHGIVCVDPTQYIGTLSRDGLLVVKFLIETSTQKSHRKKNNSLLTANKIKKAKQVLNKTNIEQHLDFSNQSLKVETLTDFQKINDNYVNITSKNSANTIKDRVLQPINNPVTLNKDGEAKRYRDPASFAVMDLPNTIFDRVSKQSSLQNIIPLDVFVVPVNKVNFVVQTDDLSIELRERLILEVWTNGSIYPRQAIHLAALSLVRLFSEFRTFIHMDSHSLEIGESLQSQTQKSFSRRLSFLYKNNFDQTSLLSSDLSNLSFSLKTYSFLKQKGVNKLDTLLNHSSKSLLQLLNCNKYMFYDIKRCLFTLGLKLKEEQDTFV